MKGYAANRNEENVYIGTKNKQKELLWIDKQTKRGNKNAEKVVGQNKIAKKNISMWNVLVLERDLLGTKHNNLFRMSKYSLLITCKQSGNGPIH